MAVFSVRNDQPFITKSHVKTKRNPSDYSKSIQGFMNSNRVTVKIDSSGTPHVIARKTNKGDQV